MSEYEESSSLLDKTYIAGESSSSVAEEATSSATLKSAKYSRWQSFAGVCFFVSMVGTTYAFGVYSTLLIDNLGFSQTGVDIIASVGNSGLYLSLFVGFGIEAFGLKTVVRAGGCFIFIGFLYIYMAVKQWVPADIASISVFFFISQFGVSCHVASAVTCCIRLFPPEWRGSSVGLGKGYFGLSSAVLSDFDGGFFEDSPASFLLFIATVVPIVGSVGVSFANFIPNHMIPFEYESKRRTLASFLPFYIHWVILFITLLIVGYIQYALPINDFIRMMFAIILAAVVMSVLWLPSLYGDRLIPIEDLEISSTSSSSSSSSSSSPGKQAQHKDHHHDNAYESFENYNASSYHDDVVKDDTITQQHHHQECYYGESLPVLESIKTWRFWCLYLIYFTVSGTGLMVIYNVDAIAEALGIYPSSFFVTLISLANGAGRFTVGISSDHLMRYYSKLQIMSLLAMFMSFAQGLFALGSATLLYPCLLLVGFLFGGLVSLIAVNIAEIFGSKYVATNFGAIDSAPIAGSYFFATMVVSLTYKTNTTTYDDYYGSTSTCVGGTCFRTAFMINSLCCCMASAICYMMHVHTPHNKSSASAAGHH